MTGGHSGHSHPYRRLAAMTALSFVAMYVLMYAMVDRWGHVHHNLNQVYMAALMAAPMVLIELTTMWPMYPDRRRNLALLAVAAVALAAAWFLIRGQVGIGDRQFLRSMIPHHAGALLMCEEAPFQDARVRDLCRRILASQQAEIAEMERLLADVGR